MRSVVVVFPASMCAMIPMLRVLARRAAVVLTVCAFSGRWRARRTPAFKSGLLRKPERGSTPLIPDLRGLSEHHRRQGPQPCARAEYSGSALFGGICHSVSKFLPHATNVCSQACRSLGVGHWG